MVIYVPGTEETDQKKQNMSLQALAAAVTGLRQALSADRTYYVRTDGSDTNNGLTNTSSGAFLTIQKAIDMVGGLDVSVYNVTIQIGNGTYAAIILKNFVGAGYCQITGDTTTPSNVVISASSGNAVATGLNLVSNWYLQGFKIANSSGNGFACSSNSVATINGKIEFGAITGYSLWCNGGSVTVTSNYNISGNTGNHIVVENAGNMTMSSPLTVTITGTPSLGLFVYVQRNSTLVFYGATFSGAVTAGTRYTVATNSVIETNGGGAAYFPGAAVGTGAVTGGLYI